MSQLSIVRPESAPARSGAARGFVRWVCTSNPFYVISAALFVVGLRVSFGSQVEDVQVWSLMGGLAGYTLLLAATGCLLVRFAGVWDDVRTVLLLVVLMFLVTSVTFDEVLVVNPARGFACYLGGLLLAIGVSEGVLRGIRLGLPAGFRVPYYLTLALFFVYPLALSPLLAGRQSEALLWGLFGFSPAAGLVFLTLLPAARRGPDYVRNNGSPWRWPLYPWVLFGLLAFAVPVRAFLLCWSLHLLRPGDGMIFGPYFVVPFGLAVAVLLLEIGLGAGRRGALAAALAVPVALAVLAGVGHRSDPVYQGFLEIFSTRLGGAPLYLTLTASAVFYAFAAFRRVPVATEVLTAVLVALAFVGPDTLGFSELTSARPVPVLAAALLQLGLGLQRSSSWRCLAGALGFVAATALFLPEVVDGPVARGLFVFHLALFAGLVMGAALTTGSPARCGCWGPS